MATFDAIKEVSQILQTVLSQRLVAIGATCINHDLVTTPAVGNTLTLTLYEIAEDPSARNKPDVRVVVGNQVTTQRASQGLLLRYLTTAWSGHILDDQRILGCAVQALYDNAIIGGAALEGTSLSANDEAIAVTMIPQTIEDRTHVWRAYDKPYRLSVNYEVRVAHIDPQRAARSTPQVRSRHLHHGVLGGPP